MESKLTCMLDGRLKIRSSILKELKEESKKFFHCDALIANLAIDPRIQWKYDRAVFNHELLTKGVVSLLLIIKFYLLFYYHFIFSE